MQHMRYLILLLGLVGVHALAAPPPMSKVTVHVVSAETGKPIDRANVVIKLESSRSPLRLYHKMVTNWETSTNQEGSVTLPEVPQGKIRVQVIAKNYQTFGDILPVDQEVQTLEIKLKPPQPQYTVK
jgi:5-hydroxyisourate hydrolase-like protein (transthyretin family)